MVLGLGGLGVVACSGPPNVAPALPSDGPSPGDVFGGVLCNAVRPQTEPDLMGWDPGQRANLHDLRARGVVAVRYVTEGCNVELEVLSSCIGKGSYAFTYYPESHTKTLKGARDLFAECRSARRGSRASSRAIACSAPTTRIVGTASLPPNAVFGART